MLKRSGRQSVVQPASWHVGRPRARSVQKGQQKLASKTRAVAKRDIQTRSILTCYRSGKALAEVTDGQGCAPPLAMRRRATREHQKNREREHEVDQECQR